MVSKHVVCPFCDRINRVPADRPADKSRCGACGGVLFTGKPVDVDAAGFERQMKVSGLPLLVDVWAPWCGPCRTMAPMFEKAAAELEPQMRLLKLNADQAPQISERFGIRSIPTMLLLQGGRVLARTAGAMDVRRIVDWARANLPR